jgi:O-antigen/teichoic acid export membrane protein
MSSSDRPANKKVTTGLFWCFSWRVVGEGIQFMGGVYLARLLLPGDFGLVAMVTALTGCLMPLRNYSIPSALVHEGSFDDEIFGSAFWFCFINCAIIAAGLFFAAPLIAHFYAEPQVAGLCRLAALGYVLGAAALCHRSLLVRNLDFRRHGVIETVGRTSNIGCSIVLALRGYGAWALAWGLLVEGVVSTVATFVLAPRRVPWHFCVPRLKGLLRFGLPMTGGIAATQWTPNVSAAMIGGVAGPSSLGYFRKATGSSTLAIRHLVWSVTDVLFPCMAGREADSPEVRDGTLKIARTMTILTWPACVGLVVVADLFIVGVYGAKWAEAVGMLRVLSVVAMLYAVQHQLITMLWALGRTAQAMKINVGTAVLTWIGVWIGLRAGGAYGATLGFTGVACIQFAVLSGYLLCISAGSPVAYLVAFFPAALMSALMGAGVIAFRWWGITAGLPMIVQLLVCTVVGAALYAALVLLWRPVAVADFVQGVRAHFGHERTARIRWLGRLLDFLSRGR